MVNRFAAAAVAALVLGIASPRVPQAWAEEKLNPPLVGMHDVSDPAGIVTIGLPAHIEPGGVDPNPALLAAWKVWLYDDSIHHMTAWISRKPAFARAPLHASQTGNVRPGTLGEGSGPRGTNEWWEVRHDGGQCRTFRMIEHGGEVFEAAVSCTEKSYPILTKHIEVLLAGFKGAAKPAPFAPPAGFKPVEAPDREVWSNEKSKSSIDRVLKLHAETWEQMKAIAPPATDLAPARVIVCKDPASYAEFAKLSIVGEPPPYAYVATAVRAVVVNPTAVKDGIEFERQVRRAAGIQYVRAAFGGPLPYWLEQGLAVENLFVAPKPLSEEKPNPTAVRDVKALFGKRKETLLELMDQITPATSPSDLADFDRLSWAWHWYLRACRDPSVDEGERYRKYVDTLMKTGDVIAARKVWEGADFKKMRAGLEKFVAGK